MKGRWFLAGSVTALVLAAFLAGLFLARPVPRPHAPTPPPQAIDRLLATPFADPAGTTHTLAEWRGKPLIVNFWATWCPPCLKEMPIFSRHQEDHPNIQFIGIAADLDDNVREFAAKNHISYPLLLGSREAIPLLAELGNSVHALPFTIILDAAGNPRQVILGGLDEAETERLLADLDPH